jgi:hypothetical protein
MGHYLSQCKKKRSCRGQTQTTFAAIATTMAASDESINPM